MNAQSTNAYVGMTPEYVDFLRDLATKNGTSLDIEMKKVAEAMANL